jgi:hypothetical protein
MITRTPGSGGTTVTFTLDAGRPVSVVGDFNGWDPHANPMVDGSASLTLAAGRYAFRYLLDGGEFWDDADADAVEDNGIGGTHGVLVIDPVPTIDLTDAASGSGARPAHDLEVINGIGPKIATALVAAGITSLEALAVTTPERLKEILKGAGLRLSPSVGVWAQEAASLVDSDR